MMWSRKIPAKGGNDPASGCRAPAGAMVVPALLAGQSQAKPYQFVSRADLKMIRIASHSDRGGRESHGQDQIEKGASRITSVCRGGPLLHHALVQQRVPTHARLYL